MLHRLALLACVLLIAGGVAVAIFGDDVAAAQPRPAGTVVQFTTSGGIAGVRVSAVVRSDRRVTVTERDAAPGGGR